MVKPLPSLSKTFRLGVFGPCGALFRLSVPLLPDDDSNPAPWFPRIKSFRFCSTDEFDPVPREDPLATPVPVPVETLEVCTLDKGKGETSALG